MPGCSAMQRKPLAAVADDGDPGLDSGAQALGFTGSEPTHHLQACGRDGRARTLRRCARRRCKRRRSRCAGRRRRFLDCGPPRGRARRKSPSPVSSRPRAWPDSPVIGISAFGPPNTWIAKPGDLPSTEAFNPHHTDSGSSTTTRRCICNRRSTMPLAVKVLPRPFLPRMAMLASSAASGKGWRVLDKARSSESRDRIAGYVKYRHSCQVPESQLGTCQKRIPHRRR